MVAPKKETDWEAMERERADSSLTAAEHAERILKRFGRSELGVEALAMVFVSREDIADEMGWPPVIEIKKQVRLGKAVADIVLRHSDGSVSILEVKKAGLGLRDYCTAVGQLLFQSLMAISVYETLKIRRVLVMPGPIPIDVGLTMGEADIDILPLPNQDEWRSLILEQASIAYGQTVDENAFEQSEKSVA